MPTSWRRPPCRAPSAVTPGANVITFPALANSVFGTAPPVPAATASSGLAVVYASTTTPVCTTTLAGVITMLRAGTCIDQRLPGRQCQLRRRQRPVPRAFVVTPAPTTAVVDDVGQPGSLRHGGDLHGIRLRVGGRHAGRQRDLQGWRRHTRCPHACPAARPASRRRRSASARIPSPPPIPAARSMRPACRPPCRRPSSRRASRRH